MQRHQGSTLLVSKSKMEESSEDLSFSLKQLWITHLCFWLLPMSSRPLHWKLGAFSSCSFSYHRVPTGGTCKYQLIRGRIRSRNSNARDTFLAQLPQWFCTKNFLVGGNEEKNRLDNPIRKKWGYSAIRYNLGTWQVKGEASIGKIQPSWKSSSGTHKTRLCPWDKAYSG